MLTWSSNLAHSTLLLVQIWLSYHIPLILYWTLISETLSVNFRFLIKSADFSWLFSRLPLQMQKYWLDFQIQHIQLYVWPNFGRVVMFRWFYIEFQLTRLIQSTSVFLPNELTLTGYLDARNLQYNNCDLIFKFSTLDYTFTQILAKLPSSIDFKSNLNWINSN
jgi:hypothetical protein